MKPKKIWSNLGVSDLDRTTKFYNALGFKPNGKHSVTKELTSFLKKLRKQAGKLFLSQKNLEKDIMVLFLQTLTDIRSMYFICKQAI